MDVTYETKETYIVSTAVPEAVRALHSGLKDAGYKPDTTADSVRVSIGLNRMVRFWGTLTPWGRKNVPVGMTVSFAATPEGTVAAVHAHDELGWFFDLKTNSVFREESLRKISLLVDETRRSLQL